MRGIERQTFPHLRIAFGVGDDDGQRHDANRVALRRLGIGREVGEFQRGRRAGGRIDEAPRVHFVDGVVIRLGQIEIAAAGRTIDGAVDLVDPHHIFVEQTADGRRADIAAEDVLPQSQRQAHTHIARRAGKARAQMDGCGIMPPPSGKVARACPSRKFAPFMGAVAAVSKLAGG